MLNQSVTASFLIDMKRFRKSRGSMFKHFFIQVTATVLFCLLASSFLLIFFFGSFWKTDIITTLTNETNGVKQALAAASGAEGKTDTVLNSIASLSYASSNDLFVVNSDGVICLCKDMQETVGQKCIVHSVMKIPADIMKELKESPDSYSYEGEVRGLSVEDVFLCGSFLASDDGTDYYIVVIEDSDTAYQPYTTEFVRMVILTGLAAVLISFFASIVVSYRMSKPIKKITEATKQYAGGNFDVKIPDMHSYNELESLIESVNSMADSLSVLEQSRSNFVANVSHELKTPMTIISGFIDGMLDGTIEGEDREKYLKIVSDEVKRLSKLVIAMLNMSKIEAGKLTLKRSDVNLQRMIFSILLTFEKVLDERHINILGMDSLESITLNADDALINQVLYNIIDNAVKFTPENGDITIGLVGDKKTANISIRNTGAGISKEDAALIFDRFYKVDKSRRLDSHSFGMGLYIVKSIVELHGGTISVNSEPGKFTEFLIKLPM